MGILRVVRRGAVAGIVGTAAMDMLLYRRDRAGGGDSSVTAWEFSTMATDYGEDAPAPARVGKRLADRVGLELKDSWVAATSNVVHWSTGVSWGTIAGVAAAVVPRPAAAVGLATGVVAWGTSYAVLGRAGIYEPITSYDRTTLWNDLSAHLVFGGVVGAVLTAGNALRR